MINSSGSFVPQQSAPSATSGAAGSTHSVAVARCAQFDRILAQLQNRHLRPVSLVPIAPPGQQLAQLQQDGCAHS